MIVAGGGEFLECYWDEGAFVAVDLHGTERLRVTWTAWPGLSRVQRLTLVWDLCAVVIFPHFWQANAARRLDTPRPLGERACMTGFVLVKDGQWILLDDWSWVTPADQLAYRWRPVAVFPSRAQADRARRCYGCEAWRAMTILRICA